MNVTMTLLRKEDLALVMDWRMRPYITEYMYTDPVLTMEGQLKWFGRISADPTQRNWIIRYEGQPVGLINLVDIDRVNSRCVWGYYVAEKDCRSLKLATYLEWNLYDYVFETLSLHKLCNETFTANKQVVRMHQLCGSKEDGVLRDHICKNGVYYDVSMGSILAGEWAEKKKTVKYETFSFE
ncbi:MAG: UDP-4-amino-4,6-dideoxy-N-acetyl-beta-L-altrosamine N-acetyltransferase [Lachnospiraceae bacterium]|nr:UDP-4-amino-4,6-dideoxy-N-acetyl-beta-L-altrosamine N-acetyltransferase [Lachnospiraceae bacterium]